MKDYATETDIITTSDPLFYPGDVVRMERHNADVYPMRVESFAWNTLKHSWTYTLLYDLTGMESVDLAWNGALAESEAFEKELKLVSRKKFAK